jgi:hypothetical protein
LIDFRYHVASLVAVFLALALGIVIGATGLRGPAVIALNRVSKAEKQANTALRNENNRDKALIAADNAFGQAVYDYTLAHLLQGEHVVLLTAPGADSGTVTGITAALARAGATVTGQVTIAPPFFGTSTATERALASLATSLTPAGVTLPAASPSGSQIGQEAAANLIAAALMTKDGQATLTVPQSRHVLNGFGQAGYVAVSGPGNAPNLSGQATLAVIVIPATDPSAAANAALLAVAQDLNAAGKGALLAGSTPPPAPTGISAIDLVVSGNAGVRLSTVDNADTPIGQIVVVQALRDLLDRHPSIGNYGIGTGAAPSPAPSTSPTPSPSSTPSPHRGGSHR